MDEETRSHIFEPFFTTKRTGQGAGLGMATVYAIVKQLNGQIQVESQRGEGTTVRIRIPAQAGSPVAGGTVPAGTGTVAAGTQVVLVVEDEADVRNFSASVLRAHGYAVREAPDAESALALVEQGLAPHLLLADIDMPGLNGAQLASRLRERDAALRVLLMSGYSTPEGGDSAASWPFLPKPFTPEQLIESVHLALERGDHA
jgi:hypothetical protein